MPCGIAFRFLFNAFLQGFLEINARLVGQAKQHP